MEKMNLQKKDIIVIDIDIDKCDIEEAHKILKGYQEFFPHNNIIAKLTPFVKSIDIIHPTGKEDDYTF